MADSGALRQRRSKLHKSGNHTLCRSSCTAASRVAVPELPDGPEGQEVPADDAGKMRWLATRLAEAYRADPGNALLARELRMTLQALMPAGKPKADDDLADLFAEFSSA